jgi:hypothetical protein
MEKHIPSSLKTVNFRFVAAKPALPLLNRKIYFQRRKRSRLQLSLLPSLRRLSCIEKLIFSSEKPVKFRFHCSQACAISVK